MSKFHIYKDEQQQGPFTTDELKDLKITRETMVWFEGAENWKKAIEIEELQDVLKSIPPPLQTNQPVMPSPMGDEQNKEESKSIFDVIFKKKTRASLLLSSQF